MGVGTVAAILTTLSNLPQLKKCWETGSAGDLSLRGFSTLALLGGILYFKLREVFGHAQRLVRGSPILDPGH